MKNLNGGKYSTPEVLKADLELVWSNALIFNGETSWIAKPVAVLRALADKMFASAAAPRRVYEGTASLSGGGNGGGALRTDWMGSFMLTPHMRQLLYQNICKLKPSAMLDFKRLAKTACATAVQEGELDGESTIDVDALDFASFVRLDTHVRGILAAQ